MLPTGLRNSFNAIIQFFGNVYDIILKAAGLKQFMDFYRKFALDYIDRSDIVPLTEIAAIVSGQDT